MKKIVCLLALIFFVQLKSTAQYNICKTYLYVKKSFAGTIAVDDKGNQITPGVTTTLLLYITTKGNTVPPFTQATIASKKNSISFVPVSGKKIEIGKKADDEMPLFITTPKGYTLWQIVVNPPAVIDVFKEITPLKIILSASQKGKKIQYIIRKKPTELISEHTP